MGKESMQNRKPMILVLAGPNGSGKSTITTFFDKVGKYTNADDVVATTGMNNIGDKNTHKCAKIKPNQFRQYSS